MLPNTKNSPAPKQRNNPFRLLEAMFRNVGRWSYRNRERRNAYAVYGDRQTARNIKQGMHNVVRNGFKHIETRSSRSMRAK